MSDGDNVIGLYSAKTPTHAQRPEAERVPYLAVETNRVHKQPPMFRLYHPTGIPELIPYHLVLDIDMPTTRDIGILLTTGALFFEGENFLGHLKNPNDEDGLLTLLDVLQVHRAWAFRCYNPDIHLPPGTDEPVIFNITFDTKVELLRDR